MTVFYVLRLNTNDGEKTVSFGMPNNDRELEAMFKLRYQVYSTHNYIDPHRYPNEKELDDYDLQGKCAYFIAVSNDQVIASIRVIRDEYLPTEIYFDFSEPEPMRLVPRGKRVELSRLVMVQKFALSHQSIWFGLIKSLADFFERKGLIGGYAFVKSRVKKILDRMKIPIHNIEVYSQRYPADGVLSRYFNDPNDPVLPVYFFLKEVKPWLDGLGDKLGEWNLTSGLGEVLSP